MSIRTHAFAPVWLPTSSRCLLLSTSSAGLARNEKNIRPVGRSFKQYRTMRSIAMTTDGLFRSSPVTRRAALRFPDADRFRTLGRILEDWILDEDPDCRTEDLYVRVYQYYLPIYLWARSMLDEHNKKSSRPLMLGFSCPQGGGKTTMVKYLRRLFAVESKVCSGASIDDFYLTFDEQNQVAEQNPGNRLLRYRGNPGTHDIPLLCQTLDKIRQLNQPGAPESVTVVQYDKTCHHGRGDRAPAQAWEKVSNGLDVFLIEGWCLGFMPQGSSGSFADKDVEAVDCHLMEFSTFYKRLDGMLVVEVDNLDCVYEWRAQPEREAIDAGKSGLTPDQVRDFVSRFMPTYAQYTPRLYSRKSELMPGRELHIRVNERRQPVA